MQKEPLKCSPCVFLLERVTAVSFLEFKYGHFCLSVQGCLYNLRDAGQAQALAQRLCRMMQLSLSKAKTQWPGVQPAG